MPEITGTPDGLPPHIEESVQSIVRLHADHHHSATPRERLIDRLTSVLGSTSFIVVLTVSWLAG